MTSLPRTAAELMTEHLFSVRDDETLHKAAALLARAGVSGAPVVDAHGVIVGVLTEHDLLVALAPALDGEAVSATTVAEAMSRALVTVGPDAPIQDLVDLLRSSGVRRVPVVRNGRPVGVVSRHDVVAALIAWDLEAWRRAADEPAGERC